MDPLRRVSVLSVQGCVCRRSAGSLTGVSGGTPMKMPSDTKPVCMHHSLSAGVSRSNTAGVCQRIEASKMKVN